MEDSCELSSEYSIKKEDLLYEYNDYLYRNGETERVKTAWVTRRLKEYNVTTGKRGKKYYIGIHTVKDSIDFTNAVEEVVNAGVDGLFSKLN